MMIVFARAKGKYDIFYNGNLVGCWKDNGKTYRWKLEEPFMGVMSMKEARNLFEAMFEC
jgi:hypothetical protein